MYQNYDFSPYENFNGASMVRPMGFGRRGLFGGRSGSGLIRNMGRRSFDWGNLLNNAQKTLSVINQAIPVFYQIRPIWNNAKVMLNIMSAVRDDDSSKEEKNNVSKDPMPLRNEEDTLTKKEPMNGPQFFL